MGMRKARAGRRCGALHGLSFPFQNVQVFHMVLRMMRIYLILATMAS